MDAGAVPASSTKNASAKAGAFFILLMLASDKIERIIRDN
jgi:hypothetical protein